MRTLTQRATKKISDEGPLSYQPPRIGWDVRMSYHMSLRTAFRRVQWIIDLWLIHPLSGPLCGTLPLFVTFPAHNLPWQSTFVRGTLLKTTPAWSLGQGLGFRAQGLGARAQGLGSQVWYLGCRAQPGARTACQHDFNPPRG